LIFFAHTFCSHMFCLSRRQDVGRAEMSVLSQMLNGRPHSVVELTLGRPRSRTDSSVFSRARVENCDLYTIRVLRHRPGICKYGGRKEAASFSRPRLPTTPYPYPNPSLNIFLPSLSLSVDSACVSLLNLFMLIFTNSQESLIRTPNTSLCKMLMMSPLMVCNISHYAILTRIFQIKHGNGH
jgi:hypothetical protein